MRVEAIKTPATTDAFARAIVVAWWSLIQTQPTREAILVLVAQSAFETGWWKDMFNNNAGNAKSLQRAGDWYFVSCTEYLDDGRAHELLAAAGGRTDGPGKAVVLGDLVNVARKGAPPVWKRHVRLYPDHPAACFRAFPTLEAGVRDHLSLLAETFGVAWEHMLAGDITGFSAALKRSKYYSDSEDHYTSVLVGVRKKLERVVLDLSPPPADPTGALAAVQSDSLRDLSWREIEDK